MFAILFTCKGKGRQQLILKLVDLMLRVREAGNGRDTPGQIPVFRQVDLYGDSRI